MDFGNLAEFIPPDGVGFIRKLDASKPHPVIRVNDIRGKD